MIKNKNHTGYTLIETAMVIVILSLLLGAGGKAYSIWLEKKQFNTSAGHLESSSFIVTSFRSTNNRFPCPAPINAQRSNPEYGRERICNGATPLPMGCVNGICKVSGFNGKNVLIGMLPFRNLNYPENKAYDGYGSRILYAVTESQAQSYIAGGGGISVIDSQGNSRIKPDGSADFIVLSHGKDRAGSRTKDGVGYGSLCPPAATVLDGENCNDDAVFRFGEYSSATGANRHDDMVSYQTPMNLPLWSRSPDNPDNIYSLRPKNVGGDYQYNWYTSPASGGNENYYGLNTKLWVDGNTLVEGDVQADTYCRKNLSGGEDCFDPDIIGGNGLDCGNEFMRGISGAAKVCSGDTIRVECDDYMVIQSVNNGELMCAHLPCKTETAPASGTCTGSFSLTQGPHGTIRTFNNGCKHDEFTCTDGEWVHTNDSGFCSCSSVPLTQTTSCGSTACWSGTRSYSRTCIGAPTCNVTSWTLVSNSCVRLTPPPGTTCGTTAPPSGGPTPPASNPPPQPPPPASPPTCPVGGCGGFP